MVKIKKAMILSGAGLSAKSRLKTFKDSGGPWENYGVMEVCSATGYAKNPSKVLEFYNERRVYGLFTLNFLVLFPWCWGLDTLYTRTKC